MKILLCCLLLLGAMLLPQPSASAGVPSQAGDPAAAVQAAVDRYQAAVDEYRTKYRAAKPEERPNIQPPAVDGFVAEFAALAEAAPGTEAAAQAWMMVVQLAPRGSDKEVLGLAVERLVRDHATSPKAAALGSMLGGAPDAQVHLRKVIELAPKGAMQAGALMALVSKLGDDEATTAGSPAEGELERMAARLVGDYADLADARGRSYKAMAEGVLFARRHLAVGKTAPEIEAADTQGVTFKLSDYRGKVVLLDFWGNW